MNQDSKYLPEDIEFILLNCDYKDLDTEQLAFVSEMIETEEEYLLMRRTLINIAEVAPRTVDIVPPYAIKDKLMSEFEKGGSRRLSWWSHIIGTLFPKEKGFTAKPGIQMAFTLSLLALIIVVMPWGDLNPNQSSLALQETNLEDKEPLSEATETILEKSKEETISIENNLRTFQDSITTFSNSSDLNQPFSNPVVSEELAESESDNVVSDDLSRTILDERIVKDKKPSGYKDRSSLLKADVVNPSNKKEAIDKDFSVEEHSFAGQISAVNEADDKQEDFTLGVDSELNKAVENSDFTGTTIPPVISEEVMLMESVSVRMGNTNKEQNSPKRTRSLQADKELIDLLYTAM